MRRRDYQSGSQDLHRLKAGDGAWEWIQLSYDPELDLLVSNPVVIITQSFEIDWTTGFKYLSDANALHIPWRVYHEHLLEPQLRATMMLRSLDASPQSPVVIWSGVEMRSINLYGTESTIYNDWVVRWQATDTQWRLFSTGWGGPLDWAGMWDDPPLPVRDYLRIAPELWTSNEGKQVEVLGFTAELRIVSVPPGIRVYVGQALEADSAREIGPGQIIRQIGRAAESDSARPVYWDKYPRIHTLTDDFNDNSINGTKWQTLGSGVVQETLGQIRLTCSPGQSAAIFTRLDQHWTLWDSYVFVELVQAETANGHRISIRVITATGPDWWFRVLNGNLEVFKDGDASARVSAPYNPTNHRWLRVREDNGFLVFDAGPTKQALSALYITNAHADMVNINDLRIELRYDVDAGASSAGTTIFDNFNV